MLSGVSPCPTQIWDAWMSGRHLQDFLLTMRDYSGCPPPKNDRVWLRACIVLAKDEQLAFDSLASRVATSQRKTMAKGRTPDRFLLRRRGLQGSPFKCPVVREFLYDWFVDIRASVASNITPRFLLMKARELGAHALQHMRETGVYSPLPSFDREWLRRWKRDYSVVFRKPNMRFKCTKAVLTERLRAMWLNVIKVRRLLWHMTGVDICWIWSIDEKPVHFNEGGSKCVRTLEIAGAPSVMLKENHAATRERVSIMTLCTSDPAVAAMPRLPPLELLFRAKSDKRVRSLVLPKNTNVSVQWAVKGSYREEHLLAYLNKWLDPWTPERLRAKDYRILMLDVARSHVGENVLDFAFSRGYVPLFHYGCTTGVCQVNDTDCHGAFQRVYIEFEQAFFNNQQLYDPGNISRTAQQLLDDVVATWRSLDHQSSVAGHALNGLSVALDGSEDKHINRVARDFWLAAGMPELRAKAIEEIDHLVATGQLTSAADWRKVVRHPASPGVLHHEGAELEGELEDGEPPWLDEKDVALLAADDNEIEAAEQVAEAAVLAVVVETDSKADVADAVSGARRLEHLKRLRVSAMALRIPQAVNAVRVHIDHLAKGLRSSSPAEKTANEVMRRHLESVRAEEAATVTKKRAAATKRRKNLLLVKKTRAKAKKVTDKAKRLRALNKALIAKVPKQFTIADVGPLGAKGDKARRELLDRLSEASPPLTLEQRVNWKTVRDAYLLHHTSLWMARGGEALLKEVNDVLALVKAELDTPKPSAGSSASAGTSLSEKPPAFLVFYQKMERFVHKPSVFALL